MDVQWYPANQAMESSTTFQPSNAATNSGRCVASLLAGANWKPEISAEKERSRELIAKLINTISPSLKDGDGIRDAACVLGARVSGGGESMGNVGSMVFISNSRGLTSVLNWSSGRTARKGT